MKKAHLYPPDWVDIANRIKDKAGRKCERCGHPHDLLSGHVLTVHHLDGNPANNEDWNLAALCQKCHLHIQAKVKMTQDFFTFLSVSDWFKPHLEGYRAAMARTNQPPPMKPTEKKPIIVKKSVRHTFTAEEIAKLNVDFGQAYDSVCMAQADFDAVKAVHKAKIEEAESRMVTLRATINAGFEMRDTDLEVVFSPKQGIKDFYLPVPDGYEGARAPVLTEKMTPDDFQQDLIQAESVFSDRTELVLWDAGKDRGVLVIGQFRGKWYSALRCNVGQQKLMQRLDSEQKACKTRGGAVVSEAERAIDWLVSILGKDAAKGFLDGINKVLKGEADKVE